MTAQIDRQFDRRLFLAGGSALALAGCSSTLASTGASATSASCLPRVKVSADRVIRTVAGLRPYRPSGYRVEVEQRGETKLVHNYGHGGGGISLSWGSSREAVSAGLPLHSGPVAVLGAGALGLTTARLVQEAGYDVTIYAKDLPPHTTSNIAGGQILPTGYYDSDSVTPRWRARSLAAADYTRRRMQIMVGDDYGIRWLPTYDQDSRFTPGAPVPAFPDRQRLSERQHPFALDTVVRYSTMYVETGRFLASVLRDVRIAGGKVVVRDFVDAAAVSDLSERLVFNCTGLGARTLFGDTELVPVRGQLAILIPQHEVDYAYSFPAGYMFPRGDGILLGGTYERGEEVAQAEPDDIARILQNHRHLADGWRCA